MPKGDNARKRDITAEKELRSIRSNEVQEMEIQSLGWEKLPRQNQPRLHQNCKSIRRRPERFATAGSKTNLLDMRTKGGQSSSQVLGRVSWVLVTTLQEKARGAGRMASKEKKDRA